jgi:hypothetical protein
VFSTFEIFRDVHRAKKQLYLFDLKESINKKSVKIGTGQQMLLSN